MKRSLTTIECYHGMHKNNLTSNFMKTCYCHLTLHDQRAAALHFKSLYLCPKHFPRRQIFIEFSWRYARQHVYCGVQIARHCCPIHPKSGLNPGLRESLKGIWNCIYCERRDRDKVLKHSPSRLHKPVI